VLYQSLTANTKNTYSFWQGQHGKIAISSSENYPYRCT
jgi:hypothetical protein